MIPEQKERYMYHFWQFVKSSNFWCY